MRCLLCGSSMNSEDDKCNNCGHMNTEVKVLTPEEKKGFQGITIDQNTNYEDYQYNEENNNRRGNKGFGNYRVYNLNSGMSTWLLLLSILVVAFFIALPLLLLVAVIITVGFFLKRIKR